MGLSLMKFRNSQHAKSETPRTMANVMIPPSFRFVKHRMSGAAWKNVQKLAYPFFLLTFVHLVIVLAPAAAHGGAAAQTKRR